MAQVRKLQEKKMLSISMRFSQNKYDIDICFLIKRDHKS